MFGFFNTRVELIYNVVYLFLLIILSIGVSYFLYRKTNPPISTFYKTALIILRGIALALIFLIFFEPIFSFNRIIHKKIKYMVLVDNSVSAGIDDGKYNRKSVIKNIINEKSFDSFKKNADVGYYKFSSKVDKISIDDTLNFSEEGTNIGKALEYVLNQNDENNPDGIILITDGIYNLGEDPIKSIEKSKIPTYTIGIGDSTIQKDIFIKNIVTNEITYLDSKVNVDVLIKNVGFLNEKSTITLSKGDKVLDTKIIELPESMRENIVSLTFVANEEGMNEYKVSLMPLSGESILKNNQRSFFIKILKNKIRLILISGDPTPDYGFLVRTFSQDKDVELTTFIEKKGGVLFNYNNEIFPQDLSKYDAVILLFYPTENSSIENIEILRQGVEKIHLPIFTIIGKNGLKSGINLLRNFMPLESKMIANVEFEAYVKLSEDAMEHPLMRILDLNTDNLTLWRNLPPFYYSGKSFVPKLKSKILAVIDNDRTAIVKDNQSVPFVFCSAIGERKFILINGYGFWKWDLLLKSDDKFIGIYDKFFRNAIRWLINREEERRLKIYTDKEIYNSGEEILINAQVYDDNYKPVENSEVKVVIKKGNLIFEKVLNDIRNGNYQSNLEMLEPGKYTFKGEANYFGRKIDEDDGEFSVTGFSMELLETRMRSDVLKNVSDITGGKFYTADNFEELFNDLSVKRKEFFEKFNIEIYNKWILLTIIVFILFTEWFLRKRLGML